MQNATAAVGRRSLSIRTDGEAAPSAASRALAAAKPAEAGQHGAEEAERCGLRNGSRCGGKGQGLGLRRVRSRHEAFKERGEVQRARREIVEQIQADAAANSARRVRICQDRSGNTGER